MTDDLVPEEREQEYNDLLAVLRHASQKRVPITASEQTQIRARVQARLAQATSASSFPNEVAFTQKGQFVPHTPMAQRRKRSRFVSNLLIALVVIGIMVGSWALFRTYPSSNGTPVPTSVNGKGPIAQAQAGGLEASMRVLIGGPYFLSELLPIDVSLTNHTHQPVMLDGTNHTADLCFASALMVQVTAGGNPSFSFPKLEVACTQPAFLTEVQPGQTLTIHQYIPLTRSREVTLTMGPSSRYRVNPLDRHWPTVHIQVNPQVPPDRALSLQNQETQVSITIPAGVKAHLLSMQTITCENYGGSYGQWTPLSTTVLHEPDCPSPKHRQWNYIVSAPGYAIVSGSQTG